MDTGENAKGEGEKEIEIEESLLEQKIINSKQKRPTNTIPSSKRLKKDTANNIRSNLTPSELESSSPRGQIPPNDIPPSVGEEGDEEEEGEIQVWG